MHKSIPANAWVLDNWWRKGAYVIGCTMGILALINIVVGLFTFAVK
jgi:hypothetical protein